MVRTGGKLSAKMIELIGDLNEKKTKDNIDASVRNIQKKINSEDAKIKLHVKLFGRVEDMRKDISNLNKKIKTSSSISKVKLGVELEGTTVGEINEQIKALQTKINSAKSTNKLKLDVDFDFKGSASVVTEEMDKIYNTMKKYKSKIEGTGIVDLEKDKQKVKKDTAEMGKSIGKLGGDVESSSNKIERHMRGMTDSTGKFSVNFKRDVEGSITGANATIKDADGTVNKFKYSLNEASKEMMHQSSSTKMASDQSERFTKIVAETNDAQRKLNKAMAKAPEGYNKELAERAQKHIDNARAMEKDGKATNEATTSLSKFKNELKNINADHSLAKTRNETRDAIKEFERLGGQKEKVKEFNSSLKSLGNGSQAEFEKLSSSVKKASDDLQIINKDFKNLGKVNIGKAIQTDDINSVKTYIGELKNGTVESVRFKKDHVRAGKAVDQVKVAMQASGGVIKNYTMEYDKTTGALRQVDEQTKEVTKSTAGMDSSFKGILGRITQYFGAMQVLQKTMQMSKKVINEIMTIDKRMTELRRVADPSLNIDTLLERSIGLSKELGASVNDVVDVVGDLARTFGEFNEEQLLAIANTSVLMQNVSELSLQEASSTIIATMKAFNIEAEDSIEIVNTFNEVDNNFAISTKQISEAMSRAGATAQTFGVDMQEVTGDVTAIGEVTQESGKKIGTALRTIYSRITTHEGAGEQIESVGVALRKMGDSGPEIRDVSDILGDLSDVWGDLTSEQQQNLAVQVAGRHRMTQFLALMNNHQVAVDATTTAYQSQGSALNEQREYMKSYEYQMKVMGGATSDLALSIEGELVGSAMYLLIDTATTVVEGLTSIVDTIGFLPTVVMLATTAIMLFNKEMGNTITGAVLGGVKSLIKSFFDLGGTVKSVGTIISGVMQSISLKTAVASAGATVLLGFIAKGVEKLINKFAEQKQASKEAEMAMKESIDVYNQHGNDISTLIERYDELNEAQKGRDLDTEEEREYLDLINQISTALPGTIDHIDAEGQARLRNTEYIEKQADMMKELADANALAVASEAGESFDDLGKKYADAQKRVASATQRVDTATSNVTKTYKEYEESVDQQNKLAGIHVEKMSEEAFNARDLSVAKKEVADATVDMNSGQFEMNQAMQESLVNIGDYVVGMKRADGALEGTSSATETLVRRFAVLREEETKAMLGAEATQEEYVEAMDTMMSETEEFADALTGAYDNITSGMDDIQTEKVVSEMENLVSALPDDAFEAGSESMANSIEAVGAIVGDVANNVEIDVDELVDTLQQAGMSSEEANKYVNGLATAFENQQLQAMVANDELAEYNEELVKTKDNALEAINPLETLFGFDSDTFKNMDSYIQQLDVLKSTLGEGWEKDNKAQESLESLGNYFQVSAGQIADNYGLVQKAIVGINDTSIEWSDESSKYIVKFGDTVDDTTKGILQGMLNTSEGTIEFSDLLREMMGVATLSGEETSKAIEKTNKRFEKLKEDVSDESARSVFLNGIRDDLDELRGSLVVAGNETDGFKLKMADGSESEYLDNLMKQLEGTRYELVETDDGMVGLHDSVSNNIIPLIELGDVAQDGAFALDETTKALKRLTDESLAPEERETVVTQLNEQLESFGGNVVDVSKDSESLKLQFADGSTSPWLENFNELVKDLGVEVELADDGTLTFKETIKEDEEKTVFKKGTEEAKELKEETGKTDKAVDEFTEKEREVDIGYNSFDVETGTIQTHKHLELLTEEDYVTQITSNSSPVKKDVEDVKEGLDDIEDKNIEISISETDRTNVNKVLETVGIAQQEMLDLDEELERIHDRMQVTNEEMNNLMTNTENINNARNQVRKLNEDVDIAIDKMAELYKKFSSGGIDTSTISDGAKTISDEAGKIEKAVLNMATSVTKMNTAISSMGVSFNIKPLLTYKAGIMQTSQAVSSSLLRLASTVRVQMKFISGTFVEVTNNLKKSGAVTSNTLNMILNSYKNKGNAMVTVNRLTGKTLGTDFNQALTYMLDTAKSLRSLLATEFDKMSTQSVIQILNMGQDMRKKFASTTNDIISVAEGLPGRIGNGIRDNIASATGSMTTLARGMVNRFKKELGIHSPSRVFTTLGGHVIDGLVNGLTDSNITNLGQNVFSDFSDGAISTINEIKGYMTFEPVTAGSFGGGFTKTSGFGPRKSPGGIGSTNHKGVDFGAPTGTPIRSQSSGRVVTSGYHGQRGNYVIVESGDGKRHLYQHNSSNAVRAGEMVGRGQVIGRVGSTGTATGPHVHYEVHINGVPVNPEKYFRGFAEGGFVDKKELAWHGEEGLEAIIPLTQPRRERGLDLWSETGEKLGLDKELVKMIARTSSQSVFTDGGGGFSPLDGESASGERTTATAGTMKPDFSGAMRVLGMEQQQMFSSMAKKEKPEKLYKRNKLDMNIKRDNALITKANTELKALTEQTLKYRNALTEVNHQESRLLKSTKSKLKSTQKRQKQIEKELSKLSRTSKHTVKQRKQYNKLQKEFDKNTESIYSMENEIKQLNNSMDERKLKIYTDHLNQLVSGFDELSAQIKNTKSDLEFSLDYLKLTDEDDVGGQIDIQYDILKESVRLEKTLMNSVNKLQKEYNRAVSKYGKDSEQALSVRKELWSAEDGYQGSVLDRIKLEKEIEKTRRDVADESISKLKDYYKQTQSMTEKAIEAEKKSLDESHEHKMSLYDDEISKIESVYDAKLKEMDDEKAEEEYQEQISDLNEQRAELMSAISRASRDTSLEGKKRLAEMQENLDEVNEEMTEVQEKRQDDLYRASLEKQKQEQIEEIELKKETAEKEREVELEALDKQLEDSKEYAEKMTNDEAKWKRIADDFVAGDTDELVYLFEDMNEEMSRFMSGDLSGVSMGYGDLTQEERDKIFEDSILDLSNMMVDASEATKRFTTTANEEVENIGNVSGKDYDAGRETSWSESTTTTTGKTAPTIKTPPKPKPKPNKNRTHKVKKNDTLWDLAQRFYGNPYKWKTIYQANQNPDPRRLQIGRKLIIPFRDGGYTGDWSGDEGRIAMLHKKELVLNESQTNDILDVAKIVQKIAGAIPKLNVNRPNVSTNNSTNKGDTYAIDNLSLVVEDFDGDKDDVRRAFDNMAKELKKRGKK